MNRSHGQTFASCLMALGLMIAAPAWPADVGSREQGDWVLTGSGSPYETRVQQRTEGELTPEDARQASILGSRILLHVRNAERALDEMDSRAAREELELAQELAAVVRKILPVTTVTTEVRDAEGHRVYRYQDQVQNDELPIVEGLTEVQVVKPIIDAKQEQSMVQGFQLADANVVHTSILLDLAYVESRIKRALSSLEQEETVLARGHLLSASAYGVRFVRDEEDHPLVAAQAALRLAERQTRNEKYEGAKANLHIAQVSLETYRAFLDEAASEEVAEMIEALDAVAEDIRDSDAADRMRQYWNEMATWFTPRSGTARATVAD